MQGLYFTQRRNGAAIATDLNLTVSGGCPPLYPPPSQLSYVPILLQASRLKHFKAF